MTAATFYEDRQASLEAKQQALLQKKSVFAWLRLVCIIALVGGIYFLAPVGWLAIAFFVIVLLVVFAQLVYKDLANKAALQHHQQLLQINHDEMAAIRGQYFQFADGKEHIPKDHYYANDMDLFGHASLFQFINRTGSEIGSAQLASWLLSPADADEISGRQQAVRELLTKVQWMQELQAMGKVSPLQLKTRDRLQQWLQTATAFASPGVWTWLRYVLPVISVGITIAAIFGSLPMNVFYLTMVVMSFFAFQQEKKVQLVHNQLSKMVDELEGLSNSFHAIEQEIFQSPLLTQLQYHFKHDNGTASGKIKRLKKILDRLDLRFNIVLVLPLNLLFMWNRQQMMALEQWKKENDKDVFDWFESLGIMEALCSFAVIQFNNPHWVFPVLVPEHFYIEANEMGHPLIQEDKRVNNYIKIDHKGEIMLVTGSNMAGKSTYLRSVGINVILAMAGSTVCAHGFKISPVQLLSSMRIADNLEESTSTFYAELKKLKTVIDKVNNHEKVFILLDEILRGTNSYDRHTGSEALIKQLIKKEAAGIIATHDVALANLEQTYPGHLLNYHFDVQVNHEELYFDYKLKPGVCTSLNASILMKKIGIEI